MGTQSTRCGHHYQRGYSRILEPGFKIPGIRTDFTNSIHQDLPFGGQAWGPGCRWLLTRVVAICEVREHGEGRKLHYGSVKLIAALRCPLGFMR